jgi:hypothetical protein
MCHQLDILLHRINHHPAGLLQVIMVHQEEIYHHKDPLLLIQVLLLDNLHHHRSDVQRVQPQVLINHHMDLPKVHTNLLDNLVLTQPQTLNQVPMAHLDPMVLQVPMCKNLQVHTQLT